MKIQFFSKGKVRDIYTVGKDHLLLVATDRISAFDIVLPQTIPGKGKALTEISNFWMGKTEHIIENHLANTPILFEEIAHAFPDKPDILERSVIVKNLRPILIEFVVRGYISGSAWTEYKATGEVQGYKLPRGMTESERFEEPLFTPTTKARVGNNDIPLTRRGYHDLMRPHTRVDPLRLIHIAVDLYEFAMEYAFEKGIILADTKFEFGLDEDDNVYLIDEALTPDSSRFWPVDSFSPGGPQQSFDKQYVRDYLISTGWDKKSLPPPVLPKDVIANTTNKYNEICKILMG